MPQRAFGVPRFVYGVTGYPLGHSLSPALHNWAFRRLKHPGAYLAWPQPPGALPGFISAVRAVPLTGLSLTIPHKETVIPLLDALTGSAKAIGAVNTLFWRNGALWGDNTDLTGFLAPLAGRPRPALALLLGGGGAARSVLAALARLGVPRIVVAVRDARKTANLAKDFPCSLIPWEERLAVSPHAGEPFWVINSTPLGMRATGGVSLPNEDANAAGAEPRGETPYSAEAMIAAVKTAGNPALCLAYDLIYNPLRTRFLSDAAANGWGAQDGLDMFVAQARAQSELWTGQSWPPDMTEEARALLLSLLGEKGAA